jgi:hypothetical protein
MFSFQQRSFEVYCGFAEGCERQNEELLVDYGDDVITKLGKQLTTLSLTATRLTDIGYLHLKNFTR